MAEATSQIRSVDEARRRVHASATTYSDIVDALGYYVPGGRVLHIGSAHIDLAEQLDAAGFRVMGLDPGESSDDAPRSRRVSVETLTLEAFRDCYGRLVVGAFDAVTLVHVLEYAPEPARVIEAAATFLRKGGVVCVRTRNDGIAHRMAPRDVSAARTAAAQDAIHAFDFDALSAMLERAGFDVVHGLADFPVELMELVADADLRGQDRGRWCHDRRATLEIALPPATRALLASALAVAGLGSNCLVFGRKR